jgi:hypothetical protein
LNVTNPGDLRQEGQRLLTSCKNNKKNIKRDKLLQNFELLAWSEKMAPTRGG